MDKEHEVRIHIDQHPYHSPNPTTGVALYRLGKVREGYELYKEVGGNHEDEPVPDDHAPVHLKEDEHFHSAERHVKKFTIVVNGEQKVVDHRVLTFDEVVKLAFPNPPTGTDPVFSVTYKKTASEPHQGTIVEGGKVKIKNGSIFDVTSTSRS